MKNNDNFNLLVGNIFKDYIMNVLLVGNMAVINEVGDTLSLPNSYTRILKLDGTHGVIFSRTLFFMIRLLLVLCDDTSYDQGCYIIYGQECDTVFKKFARRLEYLQF